MKRVLIFAMACVLATFMVVSAQAGNQGDDAANKATEHSYVGVSKCGMCHKAKAKGNQLAQWQESAHAQAYATLATDAAKAVAKKAGVSDPQKSPKCLECHVTAYGVDKKLLGAKYSVEDGVGCESCHGPGSDYMKMSTMKDQEKAVAAGMVVPTEKTCVKCHNEKSPTYKKFVFKDRVAQVAHPRPKAAK